MVNKIQLVTVFILGVTFGMLLAQIMWIMR